ncbi:metal ABC transporter solute-binding protein, Zn/Mn family [Rubrobacter indicoceani]|uniref:metal ABC transporter solute-binding protein, Zn/Mn family n=1 Tax=Rubrobacter indicoceani TaxID=2051957 RepID=UPI000E5B35DB|nr:zinc ABC transporter substrate-binding protein [Rubrobacter indicoceani]
MHVKRMLAAAAAAVTVSLGMVGCSAEQVGREGSGDRGGLDGKLNVVATYSILGDYVRNVGAENIELQTLVGPDGDAHTFEPTPQNSATLSEADLVFENGLEFEVWLYSLYKSSGAGAERVVVTENIEPLVLSEEEAPPGPEEGPSDDNGENAPDEYDPHVWQDVSNAGVMVEAVRDALVESDPDNAAAYRRNAEEYLAELEELDAWISEESEGVPPESRRLVTSHDTFGYFSRAYDYEVVGAGLASFTTEAADPSAGETAGLVGEIELSGVPAIFTENISNPALMEQVACEAGVELAPPLYTDALGEKGTEGETYVGMMRYNVATITDALDG